MKKAKNIEELMELTGGKWDCLNRIKAILEILEKEPKTFEYLKMWIASNDYITSCILEFMLDKKIISLKNNLYYFEKEFVEDE